MLPERANTAGAWLAGAVPHRGAGGKALHHGGAAGNAGATPGKVALEMLETPLKSYLLVGAELEFDAANPAQALAALAAAEGVVAISAYLSESLLQHADVILPAATFTETFGTYVNATGNWQSARGATSPPGDARPSWKIFRVLADQLELDGFAYDSPEAITRELQALCSEVQLNNLTDISAVPRFSAPQDAGMLRAGETPIYATDPIVRRSVPLQKSFDGLQAFASLCADDMQKFSISDGDALSIRQNGRAVTLPARLDDDVPSGCVWVPAGLPETAALGTLFGAIEVSRA
jgi:NADH-quinone oxidoreductase subunit G